ncbi:MAG: hypothetical protein J0I12_23620 [Candidatus Eremiobacteraeota bacterium]|nr:hypothetical protein [Candidatus Eremiobacteraeota bacterium]
MGILSGLRKIGGNAARLVSAPVRGAAKIVGTQIDTSLKVSGNLLRLQPGKALDSLQQGLHQQVDNVIGVPKEEWSAVQGAARGYGQVLVSGAAFAGEPIRGVGRMACNGLSTVGNAGGRALNGDLSGAAGEVVRGSLRQNRILGETVANELHHLK